VATNQKVNKTVKTLTCYLSFCSLYFHSLPTINGRLEKTLFLHQFDKFYKEGGKLILMPREKPLSLIHLGNLTTRATCWLESHCKVGITSLPSRPIHDVKTSVMENSYILVGEIPTALLLG
jgi:hypothetical protein